MGKYFWHLFVVLIVAAGSPTPGFSMEWNTDRPGSDITSFDLPQADPNLCRSRCDSEARCRAWTYVKPGTIQGPSPRCWLKHSVPPARGADCCVSGVKGVSPPPPPSGSMEWNTDRPGSDITSFDLPQADPSLCRSRCDSEARCRAWTYVKPGTIQGPSPRCWLKHSVPPARGADCCVSGVKGVSPPPPPPSGSMEWNTDRPGSDITSFDLPQADPNLCRSRCDSEARCRAWTYVKPGTIQGPSPRCWLKHSVPPARGADCCVSGVKGTSPPPPPPSGSMEWNTDRPGSDITSFDLPQADPNLCRSRCDSEARCRAWTYVKPGTIQGPRPRCWLKHSVPRARSADCCVSGVK